jgi:TatD DNase family protein
VIGAGFFLGIGGVITFKNSGLQEVVREIGLDHVLLEEQDAPYLAPVPFRGQRNEPAISR